MNAVTDKSHKGSGSADVRSRRGTFNTLQRVLAQRVAMEHWVNKASVIELAPGKGDFTKVLIACGVRERNIVLVEQDAERALILRGRYPAARILAMKLSEISARRDLFREQRAGVVVSRLPLFRMPTQRIMGLLGSVFRHVLRDDGALYQTALLSSCLFNSGIIQRFDLHAECTDRFFLRVPPTAIYRIGKPWL